MGRLNESFPLNVPLVIPRSSEASSYHQLGTVAEELREFEEARKNYEKALEIYIEFKDQYYQEIVKRSLKRLEEREG